jgi:hypothetical protein
MAVIISSHKSTVAMMNSIHTLLSENHPCTLFMASLHPGYHAPIEQDTLSHLRQMTKLRDLNVVDSDSGLVHMPDLCVEIVLRRLET